jgi:hypothetical protein
MMHALLKWAQPVGGAFLVAFAAGFGLAGLGGDARTAAGGRTWSPPADLQFQRASGELSADSWAALLGIESADSAGASGANGPGSGGEDGTGSMDAGVALADVRYVATVGRDRERFLLLEVTVGDEKSYRRLYEGDALGTSAWNLTELTDQYVVLTASAQEGQRFSLFGPGRRQFDSFLDRAWNGESGADDTEQMDE